MKTVILTDIEYFTSFIPPQFYNPIIRDTIFLIILLIILAIVSSFGSAFFILKDEENTDIITNSKKHLLRFHEFQKMHEKLLINLKVSRVFIFILVVMISSQLIDSLNIKLNSSINESFLLKLFISSSIIILFGILLPKASAIKRPQKVVAQFIGFIYYFNRFIYPVSVVFIQIDLFLRKKITHRKTDISFDNLSSALDITNTEIKENKKILRGIVSYGNTDASQIMKPRVDIIAFNISTPFSELLDKIKKQNYSRIPVFSETLDNIKGVLFVKDLLPHFHKPAFNWQSLIRPAYFVPRSKKINDLLLDFQTKKVHMSIVIDEYGGTSGIVTFEDVLEEIVGEIVDDFETENESYKKLNDHTYIFEGKTFINDFYKIMNLEDDFFEEIRGDADTMAGIILELNGEIPKISSVFNFKNYIFKIISADKRRIKQIQVTLQNAPEQK